MNRIYILLAAVLLITFSSCGSLKRNKQKKRVETVTDSTVERHAEVTETIDTTLLFPSDTLTGEKSLDEITDGDSLVVDGETQKVVVKYNKTTKRIRATAIVKPKEVSVQMSRKTVSDEKVKVRKDSKTEIKEIDTQKEGFPNWLRVAGYIIGFIGGAWLIWWLCGLFKRKKK